MIRRRQDPSRPAVLRGRRYHEPAEGSRPFLLFSTVYAVFAVCLFARLPIYWILVAPWSHDIFEDAVLWEASGTPYVTGRWSAACGMMFHETLNGSSVPAKPVTSVGGIVVACILLSIAFAAISRWADRARAAVRRFDRTLFYAAIGLLILEVVVLLGAAGHPEPTIADYERAYRDVLLKSDGGRGWAWDYGRFLERFDRTMPDEIREHLSPEALEEVREARANWRPAGERVEP